jgi:D-alanyl-D-alanine carboxypeptidase
MPAIIEAPVAAGQPLAELKISLNGEDLAHEQLRALEDNPSGTLWQRTVDSVMLWFE